MPFFSNILYITYKISLGAVVNISIIGPRIFEVMDMVADNIYRKRMIAMGSIDNVQRSLEEHRAIVESVVNRRPEDARKAMEVHLRNVERRIEKIDS